MQELVGTSDVTTDTPLMEAGIDSLAATELANRLQPVLGISLSPTLVFEQPTPRAITAHVVEQLGGWLISRHSSTAAAWSRSG